jgi:hypothetical protein
MADSDCWPGEFILAHGRPESWPPTVPHYLPRLREPGRLTPRPRSVLGQQNYAFQAIALKLASALPFWARARSVRSEALWTFAEVTARGGSG